MVVGVNVLTVMGICVGPKVGPLDGRRVGEPVSATLGTIEGANVGVRVVG